MLTPPLFLTLLFVNYHIPRREIKIGPVRVELKTTPPSSTAVFDRRIVTTGVGAPLTDTTCLDALGCV